MPGRDVARHRNFTKQIRRRYLLLVNYNLRRAALSNDSNQSKTHECLNVFRNGGARLHSKVFGDLSVSRNVTASLEKANQVVEYFFLPLGAWESREHIFVTNRVDECVNELSCTPPGSQRAFYGAQSKASSLFLRAIDHRTD